MQLVLLLLLLLLFEGFKNISTALDVTVFIIPPRRLP